MQLALHTQSSVEAYITGCQWRDARLLACPLHPDGGCSIARHGSYARVTPQGLRVDRWYCPQGHRTFSLLPDFLAARGDRALPRQAVETEARPACVPAVPLIGVDLCEVR